MANSSNPTITHVPINGSRGWIGVDLDRTLAVYNGWKGERHIGEPIMPMVERIRRFLAQGYEVRIFTARWADVEFRQEFQQIVWLWLDKVGLPPLRVTNEKDYECCQIWDDIAVSVEPNTGRIVRLVENVD